MPSQPVTTTPGTPASANVGTSGSCRLAIRAADGKSLDGAGAHLLVDHRRHLDDELDVARDQIVQRQRAAPIRRVHHLHAGLLHEQHGREVRHRALAGRAVGELALALLGIGDELLHRIHRDVLVDHHGGRIFGGAGDRHHVLHRIERRPWSPSRSSAPPSRRCRPSACSRRARPCSISRRPMTPLAPGLFSTTTGWLNLARRPSATAGRTDR